MSRVAIAIVVSLLTSLASIVRGSDGPLRVSAALDISSLNVTQRTTLTVTARVAQGWALVDCPIDGLAPDGAMGPLHVVSAPMTKPSAFSSGWTTTTWTIELAPDLPGSGEIPALRFKAQAVGGDAIAIERTAPIPVSVESLLGGASPDWDPTALRPALEPLPEPEEPNIALYASLGALLVIGAGALALTLVSRRRVDPRRARLKRLDARRAMVQSIDASAPVAEVAEVAHRAVREALAECAGPTALAALGAELPGMLRGGAGLSATDAALVCDFLARAESARFDAGRPDPVDAGALRADAVRAIESVRLAAMGRDRA